MKPIIQASIPKFGLESSWFFEDSKGSWSIELLGIIVGYGIWPKCMAHLVLKGVDFESV